MIDDHRQDVANLIARWAVNEGGGLFLLDRNGYPNNAAYRIADYIVSNHCGDVEHDDAE